MEKFTPLFDDITAKYGVITAAVYGCIWRRCQMDRGVCDASLQTIADDLNISRRTIVTHVKMLVNDGIIKDLTPNADRKPHKYLVQEMQQTRETNTLDGNVTRETNAPPREVSSLALGKQMHQTREANAHKDTILKEDTTTTVANDSAIVFFENNIDGITPMYADLIYAAIDDYTEPVVIQAMQEAVVNGVRKWNYIEAILKNWKKNGRRTDYKNGKQSEIVKDATGGMYV